MPKIRISSVIDAPIEKVWARIRDFNGLPGWHPRMVESEIEDGKKATDIGAVRKFKVASGRDRPRAARSPSRTMTS